MGNYAQAVTGYTDMLNVLTFPNVPRNKIYDQYFDTSPFFALLRTAGHIREIQGGLFLQESINTSKSQNAVWYTGAGGWQTVTYQGIIALGWDWKFARDGVAITGEEIIKNESSPDAIADLVQSRVDISSLTLPDLIAGDVYKNNPYGTGSDGNPGNPLSIEGLAVSVDNGTLAPNFGQQSRTTYPVLDAKVNYAGSVGSTILAQLQALWSSANRGQQSRTKVCFTTEAIYNSIWGQLQTPERYTIDPRRLEALGIKTTGGNDLAFNDAVILIDEKVPTSVVAPGSTGSGGFFYGLNTDFFELSVHPDRFFGLTPWYKDPYGDQYFMDIFFAGALKCKRPNKQFNLWASGG